MSDQVILETRNLCKVFRAGKSEVRAVDDLSVSIAAGSFTALTGPSGCGKTTLLSLLGALDRPSSGQVFFLGRELSRYSDVELARLRRRMGFVFQNFSLIAGLPVWDNITYPLIPRGVGRRERRDIAAQMLARFGLDDKADRSPSELSGGEQQRVALARALAGQPDIILADEPISNLDPVNSAAVMSCLQQIHAEGKTVVLSVHEPAIAPPGSRVISMAGGRIQREEIR
ncbi:MAG: ABC transporter ATP-binding protein [Planctomycetes bacterium]|nr:ABC transporter ATP-binding protein [Planctomycetota bacterium]